LAAIFRSQNDIKVVAEAADGEEACQLSPEVLVLGMRISKKNALQVVIELMNQAKLTSELQYSCGTRSSAHSQLNMPKRAYASTRSLSEP
jgi:chemotaxis response regulator CheB